ncbi:Cof-type HAD-IIB family hydrolase [Neobacillus sp. Marseille-QA0830]
MTEQSIIFFDIDGTLLTQDKKLPASTKEAIFLLKEKGHEVGIATGRAPFMFEDLRKELDINTYVCYNGQYVVLNGKVLYTNPLNLATIKKLTETALSNHHPVVYMDHEEMKSNVPEHPYIRNSFESLKMDSPTYDPHYYHGRELYQTLLFCPDDEEEQYAQSFIDLDFVRALPFSVDVIPKGGTKAKGIEKIIDRLGFPEESQYVFGYGLNDIEMLSEIKHSVAMGNAEDKVKGAAKYVRKSVEDNGIYYGLQMVGLL